MLKRKEYHHRADTKRLVKNQPMLAKNMKRTKKITQRRVTDNNNVRCEQELRNIAESEMENGCLSPSGSFSNPGTVFMRSKR